MGALSPLLFLAASGPSSLTGTRSPRQGHKKLTRNGHCGRAPPAAPPPQPQSKGSGTVTISASPRLLLGYFLREKIKYFHYTFLKNYFKWFVKGNIFCPRNYTISELNRQAYEVLHHTWGTMKANFGTIYFREILVTRPKKTWYKIY